VKSVAAGTGLNREGAIYLKTKNPNAMVTVHDLATGEITTII
jgi:hypothetical protein